MRFKILNTQPDHYPPESKEILAHFADYYEQQITQDQLPQVIGSYDIILMGLGHTWNRQVLQAAKNLKVLVTGSTGLDHIDMEYVKERGITIISLKGERALLDRVTSTAELGFGLLLSLVRHIPESFEHVKQGGWDREQFKGHELSEKIMGVIGYGRLGKIMAKQAKGFSMQIIAADPFRTEEELRADGVELVSMMELFRRADVVSVHVPLNESTVGLIGRKELSLMKSSAYFINTARGKIVDELALLEVLKKKQIAGVGVDVLSDENDFFITGVARSPLIEYARTHDNCIIVPHLAGTTYEAIYKTRSFLTQKVIAYIQSHI